MVRKARLRDAGRLAAIAEATFRDTFAAANTPENLELHCRTNFGEATQAAEIVNPDKVTLLCEQDDRLVGFAQLRWGLAPSCVIADAPVEIQRLYVARHAHGSGVAQALMRACLNEMATRRTDVVWLGVWERNRKAIAFYSKFGFQEVGEHTFSLGSDRQRDIVMARPVADAPPARG